MTTTSRALKVGSAVSDYFKLCSSCRQAIAFEQAYYVCSVSTCNRKRLPLFFCSLPCWEAHLPMMRHRDGWAEQVKAPTRAAYEREQAAEASAQERRQSSGASSGSSGSRASAPQARGENIRTDSARVALTPLIREQQLGVVRRPSAQTAPGDSMSEIDEADLPQDILIVASKLKKYVKARSEFNTSDNVLSVLSDHVRSVCVEAIKNAARDGRKTVLDRDVLKAVGRDADA